MENQNLIRLAALVKDQRDDLLARWRRQVRQLPGAADVLPAIADRCGSVVVLGLKRGPEVGPRGLEMRDIEVGDL